MNTLSVRNAFALLDTFGDQVVQAGNMPMAAIDNLEKFLNLRFPDSYRLFLHSYGSIKVNSITIYGLSLPVDEEPSLIWALQGLWNLFPDMPKNLLPIHSVEEFGLLACLHCQQSGSSIGNAPVVLWDMHAPVSEQRLKPVSPDFSLYLLELLSELKYRDTGLRTLEHHVNQFENDYLSIHKLPRNHVWRPYRFCVQDVVLGLVVVRHSLANNCLDVDVCLISDAPEYEAGSGARMASAFLLSEAYKCGGTMEIKFTENVEDHTVPKTLREFAQNLGVELRHISEGRITAVEARQLYVALTGFSDTLRTQIDLVAQQGKLSQERACYVVHHGIWTCSEVESIVFGSLRPDGIFSGDTPPEHRHLYMQEILHARAAILGGFLDRRLARRERIEGTAAIDLEDDVRRLDIEFDPNFYAKIYRCDEELPMPWVESQSQKSLTILSGHRLIVLVRARDASDLALHFQQDLATAREVAAFSQGQPVPDLVFILTPRDFQELRQDQRDRFVAAAQSSGVGIIVCPETIVALDADAAKRLASSRILR